MDCRSDKCVFVSHCILAQTVKAEGGAKVAAIVKEVIQFCMDNDINVIQMPCPELLTEAGGFGREPRGKKFYEAHGLRDTSLRIAKNQANYIEAVQANGKKVIGIIGVTFSPACSTEETNSVYRQKGIYIEELEKELEERGLHIPMISIHPTWKSKMTESLNSLLNV